MNQPFLLIRNIAVVAILAVSTFGLSGCAKEGCTDPTADNFDAEAKDDDGSCIPARDKFLSQYNVAESCPSGNFTYTVNIVPSTTAADGVVINNFAELGVAISGTVSGSSLSIPNQNVTVQGLAVSINGTGALNGTLLIINYTYNFAGGGETCTKNCTKL